MKTNSPYRWWLAAVLLTAALFPAAGTQAAKTTSCNGSLGNVRVEDLNVPDNATCVLSGTFVDGDIQVKKNATLHAADIEVRGDIKADRAASVSVSGGSEVNGKIEVTSSSEAHIQDVEIQGDLRFEDNAGPVDASGSVIDGNLKAFENHGGVTILDNTIDDNLECKDNRPAPTGSENVVNGKSKDQCIELDQPAPPPPTPTSAPQMPTATPPTPTGTPPAPTPTATTAPAQPDLQPPAVQWITPVQVNERFDVLPGASILLEVAATDDRNIAQVSFLAWDALAGQYVELGSSSQTPYQVQISAGSLNSGWNQIFANAVDQAGNSSDYPFIWLFQYSYVLRLPVVNR